MDWLTIAAPAHLFEYKHDLKTSLPDMVDEEDCGEEEGSHVDGPEEDCDLSPADIHPRHENEKGKDELEEGGSRDLLQLTPHVQRVEIGAIDHAEPHPGQEEEEVAVVEVPHTVAGEHAVVLALQPHNNIGC